MLSHAHQCPKCSHIYTCAGKGCVQELHRLDRRCTPNGYTDAQEFEAEMAWHMKRRDSDGKGTTYNKR
jgi:hypothetical protein